MGPFAFTQKKLRYRAARRQYFRFAYSMVIFRT